MYQHTSGLCWKIIILQWNKLTIFDFVVTYYLIFITYRTSMIEYPSYIHLVLGCYWIIHIFLHFCEVPVHSIRFLTMATLLMAWLFECGVYFCAGAELISEVSSTAGVNWTNGDDGKHIRCYCQACWLWHPCCCSSLISSISEFLQEYFLLFYIVMTI